MPLKSWLVNRITDAEMKKALTAYARGVLLDIGCATKPYARLTRDFVQRHVGVDHPGSLHTSSRVDALSSAWELPFRSETFDSELCTAVLEHLEEPELALREAFRVLKPEGCAIYTVPFIWHLHEEPRDFFRYSRYGLEYLFRKAGFEVVELKALAGFWVTFGQLGVYYLYRFHRGPLRFIPVIPLFGFLVQLLAYGLNRADRAERWTWAYLAVVRKPRSLSDEGRTFPGGSRDRFAVPCGTSPENDARASRPDTSGSRPAGPF